MFGSSGACVNEMQLSNMCSKSDQPLYSFTYSFVGPLVIPVHPPNVFAILSECVISAYISGASDKLQQLKNMSPYETSFNILWLSVGAVVRLIQFLKHLKYCDFTAGFVVVISSCACVKPLQSVKRLANVCLLSLVNFRME